ncbi:MULTISPECIES: membrane protein insertion efficiency factor YidD [Spiribacter]|jgi:putative membrane protein insertion efficiency factor|uniref:Putative membrane protein insertion efficiency factor n=2 Tax=Spiribacter TaxID=1335745 RepID=A0A557RMA0_9GAMM|nr:MULTISPECIES: membrane protein insertion efficiency factor YidD [Spiribacter]KAF0279351.1 membrane protein insertion efficiency factor YidD [Spiribacter roseus]KAF0281895.1 membrane protein insertion efficiency factor YidD [Spiribacter roseus]KAF0283955.1 membrane protein insertion efficiency factor YidD [Spiribacter roseus]KAF0285648.1 membrane protein insertion efficiency factor YidD [Spiribacter sp. SSL99]TVO66301.1 membrane protein insertion efficiency factor YidD [Spiribacter aquaticus
MRIILIGLLRAYRTVISPLFGPCCRFHPTCSCYAIEAVERHGALRGSYYAIRRVLRCNPFHPGGVDPVPGSETTSRHS